MPSDKIDFEPEISESTRQTLEDFKKEKKRTSILLEYAEYKTLDELYVRRTKVVKNIPKFWAVALLRHATLMAEFETPEDKDAIQYLEDLTIVRNPVEPRAYTINFKFKPNPYFTDSVLSKEFQYTEHKKRKAESADSEGFKWSMLDFDFDKDVKPQSCAINWKPGKNLSEKYPEKKDSDGDVEDLGTFFNWFKLPSDPVDIGVIIADEIYPDAIYYFTGEVDQIPDSDDSDSD